MPDLVRAGLDLLLRSQTPGGAFPAALDFPPYRYCWLRDGSFIARALDVWGEGAAAAAFHRWAAEVIIRHAPKVQRLLAARAAGRQPRYDDFLHTRYTLDGHEGREPWGNFQLDGYGTWLWALERHVAAGGALAPDAARAAALTARYLAAFWDRPCFDPWEEYPEHRHTATLAAVYGGLEAARRLPGPAADLATAAAVVRDFVLSRGLVNGALTKFAGAAATATAAGGARAAPDGSLLWAMVPFGLVALDDPIAAATVALIERDLCGGDGGVMRYAADTYYGGGEWVVLSAWLGWYWSLAGRPDRARRLLAWVEGRADARGFLPEQVPAARTNLRGYEAWATRWGPSARPLLWSHAMHLLLIHSLAQDAAPAGRASQRR